MKRKRLFRALALSAAIAAGTILFVWYSGHRPIASHNVSIEAAIGKASRVEIKLTPRWGLDGREIPGKAPMIITDRSEIDQMLLHFKLPWYQRASGLSHECGGHLRLSIVMPDSTRHALQYDHGNGIYPISKGDDYPGFCHLPDEACAFLNTYFGSLGYSHDELGISE